MLRKRSFWVGCAALLLFGLVVAGWWYVTRPEVFRQATSPDGSWSATIIRQQIAIDGHTAVFLRVQDQAGRVLWQEQIDELDLWMDVEQRFPDILIDDQRVRVGPNYWEEGRCFELWKADVEAGRKVPTVFTSYDPNGSISR